MSSRKLIVMILLSIIWVGRICLRNLFYQFIEDKSKGGD